MPTGDDNILAPAFPFLPSLTLLSLFLFLLYTYILYPVFLSSLHRIPSAHRSAPFSSLWINYIRHQYRENRTLYDAHRSLGPIVRLGPTEVSVDCVDHGIRTIYAGGFEKHAWYPNLFSNFDGIPVMFSTAESTPHSGRKRMMSNAYAKSYIQSSPTMTGVAKTVIYGRLLPQLQKSELNNDPINVRRIVECATMDIVTGYIFGLSSGSNFLDYPKEANWWLTRYQSRKAYTFWPQEMPVLTNFLTRFGVHLSPKWVARANHDLEAWTLRLCDAAENICDQEKWTTGDAIFHETNKPVIYAQLRSQLQQESEKKSTSPLSTTASHRTQIASELLDHLSAGHETSAITLTFLIYELSLRPSLQRRLHDELRTLEPLIALQSHPASRPEKEKYVVKDLPSAKSVDSLSLLHSIVMETLRLHQAIPGPQPRITPKSRKGVQLGPYTDIPPNVRVSANAYCLHRNPDVFPNPECWIPERWLMSQDSDKRDEQDRLKEMHKWFWAFGSGGRMCIGSNLAMLQMKTIVAAIVSCFKLELVSLDEKQVPQDGYKDAWQKAGTCEINEPLPGAPALEQEDAYTAQPKAEDLRVRLLKW